MRLRADVTAKRLQCDFAHCQHATQEPNFANSQYWVAMSVSIADAIPPQHIVRAGNRAKNEMKGNLPTARRGGVWRALVVKRENWHSILQRSR